MTVSAVATGSGRRGQVLEPEPRRQLRQFPPAADHAAAEPGSAGTDGCQRVHLAAGRSSPRSSRRSRPTPSWPSWAKLIETSGTASAMGMLGQEATAATDRIALGSTGDASIRYRLAGGGGQRPGQRARRQAATWSAPPPAAAAPARTWSAGTVPMRPVAGWRPATYTVRLDATRADGTAVGVEQFITGTVQGIEPKDGLIDLVDRRRQPCR